MPLRKINGNRLDQLDPRKCRAVMRALRATTNGLAAYELLKKRKALPGLGNPHVAEFCDWIKKHGLYAGAHEPVPGFTQVPNAVLHDPRLPRFDRLLYAIILSYDWRGQGCFPGQKRLADALGCGRRSVARGVQRLAEAGLLTVTRIGKRRPNVYRIAGDVPRVTHHSEGDVPRVTHGDVPELWHTKNTN